MTFFTPKLPRIEARRFVGGEEEAQPLIQWINDDPSETITASWVTEPEIGIKIVDTDQGSTQIILDNEWILHDGAAGYLRQTAEEMDAKYDQV